MWAFEPKKSCDSWGLIRDMFVELVASLLITNLVC